MTMLEVAKNGIISAVAWSTARSWGTRVATLLVFFVLTRLLSPEDIGLVSYVLGILTLMLVFADLGLAEYVVYNHHALRQTELAIWWFQFSSSVLMTVGLAILLYIGFIDLGTTNPNGKWAMLLLMLTLPLSAAAKIPEALLRRRMNYKSLAIRSLMAISISSVIAISLALMGYGIWSLVAKQVVEVVIDTIYCFKFSQWYPTLSFDWRDLAQALRGGWGMVSSRILDVITQTADTLIIGSVFGMRELGFYSMAKKIFQVLNDGVVQSVTGVVATAYGRVKEHADRMKILFLTSIKFASIVTVPVFLLAVVLAQDWIPLVFGQQWVSSVPVTQVLCMTGLMSGFANLNGFVVLANNRNRDFFTLMLGNTVVSLLLLLVLSRYGVIATAAATPIKTLLMIPVGLLLANRIIPFSLNEYLLALKPTVFIVIALLLSWLVLTLLSNHYLKVSDVTLTLGKTVAMLLVLLVLVRVLYWKELKLLRQELRAQL